MKNKHFNPLHREGGDLVAPYRSAELFCISIHSTARVETSHRVVMNGCFPISIHSTARVETICIGLPIHHCLISIHSTARVETQL